MLTEEEEYMEGLYATNDSGIDPRTSGSNAGTMVVEILKEMEDTPEETLRRINL